MANVQRICEQCGEGGPLDVRYCPHCGYDTQAALPMPTRNLPMVIGKAVLPILAGAATLALRMGWKLLQQRLSTELAKSTMPLAKVAPVQPATVQSALAQSAEAPVTPSMRARRTVRIRSTWAVGDANGVWQQGSSDHTIEFED